jgi:hypothetical protein
MLWRIARYCPTDFSGKALTEWVPDAAVTEPPTFSFILTRAPASFGGRRFTGSMAQAGFSMNNKSQAFSE